MPRITFSHKSLDLEVPQDASFLEVCKEHDAPQDFGCTVGSCGTCCIVIEKGAEHLAPVTDDAAVELPTRGRWPLPTASSARVAS